jgi:hypothetical protein
MGLINITNTIDGQELDQEMLNSRFAIIVDAINGNLDSDNIADNAIITSKLADNAVTAAKLEEQQAWQAVTYSNSWVDYDATTYYGVQYYKDSLGVVHLRGMTKSGTTTANTTMFTLPAGYRIGRKAIVSTASNNAFARVDINPDGTVVTGSGVSATWV